MQPKHYDATTIEGESASDRTDALAPEAPLHITINGESYITTMRTPDGFDEELARGLLFTEGIVTNPDASIHAQTVNDPESELVARLDLSLNADDLSKPVAGRRNQMATASCGICGTRDPADLELYGDPLVITNDVRIRPGELCAMMAAMHDAQSLFLQTGGTHGASAFTVDGTQLVTHEDIGRHNAVDKVVGMLLQTGKLSDVAVLTVSSRVSYEIVTKAYRSAIPILAAVSAPSSMAVDTAHAFGITLVGFCRENRLTVYSHPDRIEGAS
ncbi:MAG: formate dehydrogenase accessory sulfurtransferase FdhD [Candidatus Hydrogenedentota bacterium]